MYGLPATLVVLTNYAHCPVLLLHALSWPQTEREQKAASCTFLSLPKEGVPDHVPDVSDWSDLIELWSKAVDTWRTEGSGRRQASTPLALKTANCGKDLMIVECAEQSCPRCGQAVWEPIAEALTSMSADYPGPLGAAGCYFCPSCKEPLIVDFAGSILLLDRPRARFSHEFLRNALSELTPPRP